ncbi:collagen-like protein, partial [Bacillus cereus]
TGSTGPVSTTSTKAIFFEGTNIGFQRIVGSPGPTSELIPYVTAGNGSIAGLSISINVNNLQSNTYNFLVCKNVPNNTLTPSPST